MPTVYEDRAADCAGSNGMDRSLDNDIAGVFRNGHCAQSVDEAPPLAELKDILI